MIIGSEKNPKGPSFRRARTIEKELSGSRIRFLAPPHNDPLSSIQEWEAEAACQDIFDSSQYCPLSWVRKSGERYEFYDLQVLRIYSSRWGFNGLPILQGYCGHVNFLIDVNSVEDLPVNESLFENRVLAREAYRAFNLTELQDLHKGHSDDPTDFTPYRWPSYLGPLNCQWIEHRSTDWLYFESQPLINDAETIVWNAAVDDKHYLSCRFVIRRSARNAGNSYRIEQRIPRENFLKLMHQIMDSLSLDLSPEAAARRAQVQAQPGASDKPLLGITQKQVEEAKHVLYMWSDREYEDSSKGEDDDHRASREEVAAFVDERIKPRPLPNSYPPGQILGLSSHLFHTEPQIAQ